MARFVDGFVIPIKKKNLKKYKKLAALGRKVWMSHGALEYYECVANRLDFPDGLSFTKVYKLRKDETLIFAFIVYKSKAHAKTVNGKVGKDKRMHVPMEDIFKMNRFTGANFNVLLWASAKN